MSDVEFETLVQRHQAHIWRYLRVMGCDPARADDLTQETFLAVFTRPFEAYSEAASAAYLRKVAKNRFLMAVRARKCQPNFEDLELVEEVWHESVGEGMDDYLPALRQCLGALQERARKALEMRYEKGLSVKEIATALETITPSDEMAADHERLRVFLVRAVEILTEVDRLSQESDLDGARGELLKLDPAFCDARASFESEDFKDAIAILFVGGLRTCGGSSF